MQKILDVIHNTIYQFFDVCDDNEEVPISDKDKLLLEVNKAICNNLKALEQEPCDVSDTNVGKTDAISRQAAIDAILIKYTEYERLKMLHFTPNIIKQECADLLTDLPSVTPKQSGWIPVSERLPEDRREVLVTDVETSDTYLSRYIGDGYWECDNGLFKDRIIAWQPKPQSYKAESEDKA